MMEETKVINAFLNILQVADMDLLILIFLTGMLGIIRANNTDEQSVLNKNVLFHKTEKNSLSRAIKMVTKFTY